MAFCIKCESKNIYSCHFCDSIHFFCSKCHPDQNFILNICYNCETYFCNNHTLICNKSYDINCYNNNLRSYFLCPYCFKDLYKICDTLDCPIICTACIPYLKSYDVTLCITCEMILLEL